jgi:hypothetical protein
VTTYTVVWTRRTRKGADNLAAQWADEGFRNLGRLDGVWLIGRPFDESDPRHGLTVQVTRKGSMVFDNDGVCIVHIIGNGIVKYSRLGAPGTVMEMGVADWELYPAAEVECDECGPVNLVNTDCCDQPRPECETHMVLDSAGDPDVRVCRTGEGCDHDRYWKEQADEYADQPTV